ncbi:hypothetical protein LR48_Vigan11g077100 [Vigna angularis]|uniref:Uncharacterized protein n=1 Tax=Phaseolus angularis TaxID=3914 RepID=A0A0L9VS11_PHAAN|nr:hypothetical protein LR48_Vigan11g077100 [Vigna angularis]
MLRPLGSSIQCRHYKTVRHRRSQTVRHSPSQIVRCCAIVNSIDGRTPEKLTTEAVRAPRSFLQRVKTQLRSSASRAFVHQVVFRARSNTLRR